MYQLHDRLDNDSHPVCELPLCEVRLLDDQRFPWLLLIPRREEITEVHQLTPTDQQQLMIESSLAAQVLENRFNPDKINLGALGNLVPQLHWHVVARTRDDPCWPAPVWGCGERQPYAEEALDSLLADLKEALLNA